MNNPEVLTRVLADDVTGPDVVSGPDVDDNDLPLDAGYDDFPLDRGYYNLPPSAELDDAQLNADYDDAAFDATSDGEWDGDVWEGAVWDGDEWDGDVWDVDPHLTPPPRVHQRSSRDPRWLLALIGLAAAALVVATVLLFTGRGAGEIPTAPESAATRTPASTPGSPSPSRTRPSPSATTPTSASSASEEPSAVEVPAPVGPTASVSELPSEPSAESRNKSSSGPRINVTRTPMSFSPGKR